MRHPQGGCDQAGLMPRGPDGASRAEPPGAIRLCWRLHRRGRPTFWPLAREVDVFGTNHLSLGWRQRLLRGDRQHRGWRRQPKPRLGLQGVSPKTRGNSTAPVARQGLQAKSKTRKGLGNPLGPISRRSAVVLCGLRWTGSCNRRVSTFGTCQPGESTWTELVKKSSSRR